VFITDQHRSQIRGYLSEMEKQFEVLTALKPHSLVDFQTQPVLHAAGERALHIVLECLTDLGNIIIDALIMRDPASYEDIFEILTEEGVFDKAFYTHFIPAVRFRKTLVHDYLNVQAEDVWNMVQEHANDFAVLRDFISNYVKL
jgi:uncharacterized protein YutE (UPF0331/DUF86 family)